VPVGGLAIRRLLGRTGLAGTVGERLPYGDAVAIPLPHPSGASGWLNDPANRRLVALAAGLVRAELDAIGAGTVPDDSGTARDDSSAPPDDFGTNP
jgi:uracil-DNA glycosylase